MPPSSTRSSPTPFGLAYAGTHGYRIPEWSGSSILASCSLSKRYSTRPANEPRRCERAPALRGRGCQLRCQGGGERGAGLISTPRTPTWSRAAASSSRELANRGAGRAIVVSVPLFRAECLERLEPQGESGRRDCIEHQLDHGRTARKPNTPAPDRHCGADPRGGTGVSESFCL